MKTFNNILVAFDLNKTLFYKSQKPLPGQKHDKRVRNMHFYYRPHLFELVQFLHSNSINYCFWSNMQERNCNKYTELLQKYGMNHHCGIFDQQFCDLSKQKINDKGIVKSVKNLHKLAELFKINVDNCVLVDDSKEKSVKGCNFIHIPAFQGNCNDRHLLQVIQRLMIFRQIRVKIIPKNQQLLMLDYIDYKKRQKQSKQFENHQQVLTGQKLLTLQQRLQNDPQVVKLQAQLEKLSEERSHYERQIQKLKKMTTQMGQKVKKASEGKTLMKGDPLLMQVLLFAKQKKCNEKKIEELDKMIQERDRKIEIVKALIDKFAEKIKLNFQTVYQQNNSQQKKQHLLKGREKNKNKAKHIEKLSTRAEQAETCQNVEKEVQKKQA